MKLLSVNVSLPREVPHGRKKVSTGIFKEPVAGRIMLRTLNLDGNGQADLVNHGGTYRAVYAYLIDLDRLRGGTLRSAATGFTLSLAIAFGIASGLKAAGIVHAPLLVANILLSATALGIVVPVLVDAGQSGTTLSQLVIAGASIADFGAIILLSMFFSREATSVGSTLLSIGAFVLLVIVAGLAIAEAGHSKRLTLALRRLQDSSTQIRVRGALLLLVGFVWLAQVLGLEVILGAFIGGAVLRLLDRDVMMTYPFFRQKLEAVGFGVFIPFFFVTSGMRLDLLALFTGGASLALVPVLLLALLLARGLPGCCRWCCSRSAL
jgi:Kef-type K+ transport system membrane component KefB